MFPFKKMTGQITMELVSSCVLWMNVCPSKSGVSDAMSPRNIITGLMIDYNKHFKLQFGEYVQTCYSHDKITGTALTIGYLALRPTINYQGGYYFYILSTGMEKNLNLCTPLPMPDDVISRIHALAQNVPMGITFTNRNENEIEEDDDEMTMSHPTKRTSRTMSIIILTMAQPSIVGMIIQVVVMVLTHTFGPQQIVITNPHDNMTQQNRNTQHTTQDWE